MQRILFLVLNALILLQSSAAQAAVTSASDKPATDETKSGSLSPSKVIIQPHRAIYEMTLASVKNGSNVSSVTGKMLFEWSDVCDGWAVQQHLNLHFNYSDATESNITSTELTWEAKDGKSYNFNIHRVTDGKDPEDYRGKAVMADNGGTATYSVPDNKVMKLPAGTLFPSAHTKLILEKAQGNERFFSRRVFDGTDEDGSNDVSVFIDPPQAHWLEAELNPELKTNPLLLNETSWPVRMAFFKIDTETGEPDYEMDLTLLTNGIARMMRIDYGDFSVVGTLSSVEALPSPHC
jgi:hypothetical protein